MREADNFYLGTEKGMRRRRSIGQMMRWGETPWVDNNEEKRLQLKGNLHNVPYLQLV